MALQMTSRNTSGEGPKSSDIKQACFHSLINIVKSSFTLEAHRILIEIRVVTFQSNARL